MKVFATTDNLSIFIPTDKVGEKRVPLYQELFDGELIDKFYTLNDLETMDAKEITLMTHSKNTWIVSIPEKKKENHITTEQLIQWFSDNYGLEVMLYDTLERLNLDDSTLSNIEQDLLEYENITINLSNFDVDIMMIEIAQKHNKDL